MVFRPKILGLQYILLLLRFFTFFTFFFENPKKRDLLRFFALIHTFSRTMMQTSIRRRPKAPLRCKMRHRNAGGQKYEVGGATAKYKFGHLILRKIIKIVATF